MTQLKISDPHTAGLPSKGSTRSYWHREPSPTLLGHKTTQDLPATADVVVIGSGITGTFAARFLKEGWARELNVVMLEAREACWGATGRVRPHTSLLILKSQQWLVPGPDAPPGHIPGNFSRQGCELTLIFRTAA